MLDYSVVGIEGRVWSAFIILAGLAVYGIYLVASAMLNYPLSINNVLTLNKTTQIIFGIMCCLPLIAFVCLLESQ
ncbi:MAG: hypothetical protein OEZ58_02665 [Gammaproteobacteria bacterium]|nr:hypothetical protein [Gammaproteobacteria bacterium]